jgi:hypothetical protein
MPFDRGERRKIDVFGITSKTMCGPVHSIGGNYIAVLSQLIAPINPIVCIAAARSSRHLCLGATVSARSRNRIADRRHDERFAWE